MEEKKIVSGAKKELKIIKIYENIHSKLNILENNENETKKIYSLKK